jgi:hypothetical protein
MTTDFDNPVRWAVDGAEARVRITDRMMQRLPALTRRLGERLVNDPAGSRLRRVMLTRGATVGWAAYDKSNWDYIGNLYAPDAVVTYFDGIFPDGPFVAHGWPEIRQSLEESAEVLRISDQRVTEIVDYGGRFFGAAMTGAFVFDGSGIAMERPIFNAYRVGEGVVTHQWAALDEASVRNALRQLSR